MDTNEKQEQHLAREAAFRRGYQQGVNAALDLVLDALHDGVSLDDVQGIAAMYDDEIMRWRPNLEASDTPPSNQRSHLLAVWREYKTQQENR